MKIASAASAFPKHYYSQKFLLEKLQEYWGDRLRNPQMLARLHRNVAVEGRHLAMPPEKYNEITTWGQANDISSPSIDAILINRMGLPTNIRRLPIFGLGCVAGAAGIARAADYVRAYPSQAAALVSVELCSLTIPRDDLSVAYLISSGLFADGSAAVIVTGDDLNARGPEILATRSIFYPDPEQVMGWKVSEKGFRITLSPEVPVLIREHLGNGVDTFLDDHGHKRADIGSWVLHTGGPKVLEATAAAL